MSKKVTILGAKESGIGAALLAKKQGYKVFVSDFGTIGEKEKNRLTENNIPFEEGTHSSDKILKSDWVIKSPGVPKNAPIIKEIKEENIEIS